MQLLIAVDVDVALSRPPMVDAVRRVLVSVPLVHDDFDSAESEAMLVAAQLVMHGEVVMPLGARVVSVEV